MVAPCEYAVVHVDPSSEYDVVYTLPLREMRSQTVLFAGQIALALTELRLLLTGIGLALFTGSVWKLSSIDVLNCRLVADVASMSNFR
jgi:hypothetical protein